MITEFGHFVPSVVKEFKYAIKELDAEGVITRGEDDDQPSEMGDANTNDPQASDEEETLNTIIKKGEHDV